MITCTCRGYITNVAIQNIQTVKFSESPSNFRAQVLFDARPLWCRLLATVQAQATFDGAATPECHIA